MGDGVVGAHVDGLLLETEGAGEPVDGGEGVAVAKAWDDGGAAGFGLVCHSGKSGMGTLWRSWRNRGYPPSPYVARRLLICNNLFVLLASKYS